MSFLRKQKITMTTDKVLIIGAGGQIGTELLERLNQIHGPSNVVAADLNNSPAFVNNPYYLLATLLVILLVSCSQSPEKSDQ